MRGDRSERLPARCSRPMTSGRSFTPATRALAPIHRLVELQIADEPPPAAIARSRTDRDGDFRVAVPRPGFWRLIAIPETSRSFLELMLHNLRAGSTLAAPWSWSWSVDWLGITPRVLVACDGDAEPGSWSVQ